MSGSEAISPTAHYTSHVWGRNGLSHPELTTRRGRLLFELLRPPITLSGLVGGPTLESYLLARHEALDRLLERAIEEEGLTQVIEVACGLSARGWRFTSRHPGLTYVEADLPDMADHKRRALARMGSLSERHRVEEIDALRDSGPASLQAIADRLDPDQPLAILTEGLLGYFEPEQVTGLWRRIAATLRGFPAGQYLADTYFADDTRGAFITGFRLVLGAFVRGRVHMHFADEAEATRLLSEAGFDQASITRGNGRGHGADRARIIQARTS